MTCVVSGQRINQEPQRLIDPKPSFDTLLDDNTLSPHRVHRRIGVVADPTNTCKCPSTGFLVYLHVLDISNPQRFPEPTDTPAWKNRITQRHCSLAQANLCRRNTLHLVFVSSAIFAIENMGLKMQKENLLQLLRIELRTFCVLDRNHNR